MKNICTTIALIGGVTFAYLLFQNIIDWNFGWNTIPENVFNERFDGVQEAEYQNAIDFSKQLIDSIQLASQSPSISIAAMKRGKMIWSYAVGYQDIEKSIPADTSTQYRIGSVSKALTSLGLGQMIQQGDIHPDSSIQYYTDRFDDKPRITIRQLASHQSGIRNYGLCLCTPIWEYYRDEEFSTIAESMEDFEKDKLLFDPGENFAYSSYNFTALSLAMEIASGEIFTRYMANEVFDQLGMNRTKPDSERKRLISRAVPYDTDSGSFKEAFPVNLSNKWAGGGFASTPSDLARAGNALLDSAFLKREIVELITTPQRLNDGSINEQNYALGWRHNFSDRYFYGAKKVEVIHHGGMAVGGLALLIVYPEYDMVIAMTMNKSGQEGQFELFDYITPIANSFLSN